MRYLVTGGAGFIGSNTVDELVRRGHSVVVLDDLSGGKEENLAEVRNKITFIKGSISDIEIIRRAIFEADYVIHLAARTSVPFSMKDPIETNRINIDGTLNVLVAARDAKVKRIVFAASSSAYGETPTLPKVESMQPQPISPYGVTKFVGELYSADFRPLLRPRKRLPALLQYFWAAPGSHFAVFRRDGEILHRFSGRNRTRHLSATARSPAISLTWTTPCKPTFSPVKLPAASGRVFNVGTGDRINLNQVVEALGRISGKPMKPRYDPPRDGDIRDSQADISRARAVLGYEPTVALEEGLQRTFEWYRATQTKTVSKS